MNAPERIRLALPMALLYVIAKEWLESYNRTTDNSPLNIFRSPEEAEDFDQKVLKYDNYLIEQEKERKKYFEMLERFDQWNNDDEPRTLNHLLYGSDNEPHIQVIVKSKDVDYVVFTDQRGNLAYAVYEPVDRNT